MESTVMEVSSGFRATMRSAYSVARGKSRNCRLDSTMARYICGRWLDSGYFFRKASRLRTIAARSLPASEMAFWRSPFSVAASCAAAFLAAALEGGAAGEDEEDSWASAGKERSSIRRNAKRLARVGRNGSTAALYPVRASVVS